MTREVYIELIVYRLYKSINNITGDLELSQTNAFVKNYLFFLGKENQF